MAQVRRGVFKSVPADLPRNDLPKRIGLTVLFHCVDGCGFLATFEHRITEEEYESKLAEWGGHRIEDYHIAEMNDEDLMLKRLKELGYVE